MHKVQLFTTQVQFFIKKLNTSSKYAQIFGKLQKYIVYFYIVKYNKNTIFYYVSTKFYKVVNDGKHNTIETMQIFFIRVSALLINNLKER